MSKKLSAEKSADNYYSTIIIHDSAKTISQNIVKVVAKYPSPCYISCTEVRQTAVETGIHLGLNLNTCLEVLLRLGLNPRLSFAFLLGERWFTRPPLSYWKQALSTWPADSEEIFLRNIAKVVAKYPSLW